MDNITPTTSQQALMNSKSHINIVQTGIAWGKTTTAFLLCRYDPDSLWVVPDQLAYILNKNYQLPQGQPIRESRLTTGGEFGNRLFNTIILDEAEVMSPATFALASRKINSNGRLFIMFTPVQDSETFTHWIHDLIISVHKENIKDVRIWQYHGGNKYLSRLDKFTNNLSKDERTLRIEGLWLW